MTETFDYIIVGGGSAGCVLAHRLSEDPATRVLLLEAGGSDRSLYLSMPAALLDAMHMPQFNWAYESESESQLNGRRLYAPRGRVIGGSSSINALMYMRGNPLDYENWVELGAQGWSYAEVLPYFKRAETFAGGGDDYRGDRGPLRTQRGPFSNPLFEVFIEAAVQAGYARSTDLNGYRQEGFGPADMTIGSGRRSSTSQAYLKPARNRPNLEVRLNTLVSKIDISDNRARGVTLLRNDEPHSVQATREVILAAGAINSPQLLMLSGIGDSEHLAELDIPVQHHLPGVGANLMDHLAIYIQHECTRPVTVQPALKLPGRWLVGARWLLSKTGAGATNQFEASGFLRSRPDTPWPDIQLDFMPLAALEDMSVAEVAHGFSTHVGPMRPKSRGTVRLNANDATAKPRLNFNYLSEEEDWRVWRDCVRLTREIHQQPAFDSFRGRELLPGEHVQSDAEIDDFLRDNVGSVYHPSGTCRMGMDAMSVVDPACQVHGVERLRVVDTSIMPQITSGNTNAPTIMIAEKAADHIRGVDLLPPENMAFYQAED